MGQLEKARVTRDKANIRAVKEAGAVAILNDEKFDLSTATKDSFFEITATVTEDGDLTIDAISFKRSGATANFDSKPGQIQYGGTGNVKVTLKVTDLDVSVS